MLPAREFLRLRVFLGIRKPLLSKYLVKRTGMSDFWIHFRYEDLGIYCFKCGIIGNYHQYCQHPLGETPRNYSNLLSVPSCSETPAIRVPQMFTIMKKSPFPGEQGHLNRVSSYLVEPQMNTMLKEPSDLGQEVGSLQEKTNEEEEKEIEEESSDPKLEADENISTRTTLC